MRTTSLLSKSSRRIVAAHLLPEWRASEKAPQAMEAMAQEIADAMQTAKGGHSGGRK